MPKGGVPEKARDVLGQDSKDIYDAMQSLEYEINTLFTSNGQTPFTSLEAGLGTIASNRKSKGDFTGVESRGSWIGTSDNYLSKLIFFITQGLNLEPGTPNYDIKQLALG